MAKYLLTEKQSKTLKIVKAAIDALLTQQNAALATFKKHAGQASYQLGFTNALGLFGERGAGKSTLLFQLYQCWQNRTDFPQKLESLYFLSPIDCSTLSQTKIPSSVVLLNIKKSLEDLLKDDYQNKKAIEELTAKLDGLIGCSTRTNKDYRKLCLELSTSPEDYDYYQEKGIEERLHLKQKLQTWLLALRKLTGNKTLVILLDDFDLISGSQVHAWISSLLDELQQIGLIFILTADFYRLEHLSWDGKKQFDDKTGRALINKIFPPKNCIEVPEWSLTDAQDFHFGENKSLNTLLAEGVTNNPSLSQSVVFSLLPRFPRGIENLYELLLKKTPKTALTFASVLATCRNEPLLARLLKERNNKVWFNYLPLSEASLSIEQWDNLLVRARSRATQTPNTPLLPLRPLLSKPDMVNEKGQDTGLPKNLLTTSTDEHAPLFHSNIYTAPLRDATTVDANLWAELLIDLDLYNCVSHQALFFKTWKPLAEKLKSAQFEVTFPSWDLKAFFMDNDGSLDKATLCWLANPKDYTVSIGWNPLFNNTRGIETPLSMGFLTKLLMNTYVLKGDIPTQDDLKLLPDRLWSLLVFTDALERCPWRFFSRFLNWLLVTYIALAAALVASAYLYSLVGCGYLQNDELAGSQRQFIKMLKNRDPSFLLQLPEQEVWNTLMQLFDDNDNLNLSNIENLPQVAKNYLNSNVYNSSRELLKETIDFYAPQPILTIAHE